MESGSITISASEIALHLLLLPILRRFHKQYPGVRLRLLNHSTPEAVESVKNGLAEYAKGCTCPPDFPVCVCGKKPQIKLVNRKPIVSSPEELEENPRARSAKLRVAEKLRER